LRRIQVRLQGAARGAWQRYVPLAVKREDLAGRQARWDDLLLPRPKFNVIGFVLEQFFWNGFPGEVESMNHPAVILSWFRVFSPGPDKN